MARVNDLAQASVNVVNLMVIKDDILPDLVEKANELDQASEKNADIHNNLTEIFNKH